MASSSFLSVKPLHSSSSSSSFRNPPSRGPLPCSSLSFRRCSKPLRSSARAFSSARPEDPQQSRQEEEEEEEEEEQERLISSLSVEEIELKLGKRRRGKRGASSSSSSAAAAPQSKPRKDWEDMSLSEKALELYVGEKGALYWLNKFAYASIFIIIGGWIAFRFVGPALNLYQLESPLLPPDQVLRGSASP